MEDRGGERAIRAEGRFARINAFSDEIIAGIAACTRSYALLMLILRARARERTCNITRAGNIAVSMIAITITRTRRCCSSAGKKNAAAKKR